MFSVRGLTVRGFLQILKLSAVRRLSARPTRVSLSISSRCAQIIKMYEKTGHQIFIVPKIKSGSAKVNAVIKMGVGRRYGHSAKLL